MFCSFDGELFKPNKWLLWKKSSPQKTSIFLTEKADHYGDFLSEKMTLFVLNVVILFWVFKWVYDHHRKITDIPKTTTGVRWLHRRTPSCTKGPVTCDSFKHPSRCSRKLEKWRPRRQNVTCDNLKQPPRWLPGGRGRGYLQQWLDAEACMRQWMPRGHLVGLDAATSGDLEGRNLGNGAVTFSTQLLT